MEIWNMTRARCAQDNPEIFIERNVDEFIPENAEIPRKTRVVNKRICNKNL